MTATNFDRCLTLVLKAEGGNDDDPNDPGGRTSRGITQREYDAYYRQHGAEAPGDVWRASDAVIKDIYWEGYWQPWCDQLPTGIDYIFFDMAVNQGFHEAVLLLQRALGVAADGRMGPVTRLALKNANVESLIKIMTEERRAYYRSLHTYKYFGKGWMNRAAACETDALKMCQIGGSDEHQPNLVASS